MWLVQKELRPLVYDTIAFKYALTDMQKYKILEAVKSSVLSVKRREESVG